MKTICESNRDFDLSRDAILLISAIVVKGKRDEPMAYCLLEWGVQICLELGLDPRDCLEHARDDVMFIKEQGLETLSPDQCSIN